MFVPKLDEQETKKPKSTGFTKVTCSYAGKVKLLPNHWLI